MTTLEDLNLKDQKVLIRVDFNVPLDSGFKITDPTRINAALPTINYVLEAGGLPILMSHLGRPKNGPEEKFSLAHLVPYLEQATGTKVHFAADCIGEKAAMAVGQAHTGDIVLLENLRFHTEEKKGDEGFARALAALGDVYVNDAFGTAHRAHASTAIIARFFEGKKAFGKLLATEVKNLQKVMQNPEKPFLAIVGGAKVSSKIEVLESLLQKVTDLIIGGGMTFTFIKAMGGNVGNSLVEDDKLDIAKEILANAKQKGVTVHLPVDSLNADQFDNDANTCITAIDHIPDGWMGLDIGPDTEKLFSNVILGARTALWNGPVGVFEMNTFQGGTKSVAEALAELTTQGGYTLVGGGDSVAAINKFNLKDKVSYVSTGGGAMLEFLEGKELPGVKALED